jgi:adenosine deaminase
MELAQRIRSMPKAELHIHLEGTIRPSTLLTLARRNGVALPVGTEPEIERWFVYRDFDHFRTIFRTCARCLVTSDDYEQIVYEMGEDMAHQRVLYAEVSFGVTTPYFRGIPQQVWMEGLSRGRARVRHDFGVELAWRFDLGRGPEQNEKSWDYTTAVAIEGKDDGVVALGLAGPENRLNTASFRPWFDRARAAGLHSAPHAGELMGPESVWAALLHLGAERIAHGVRAVEDPVLVSYLARERIALDICPTSNLRLGVYGSLEEHPLRRLHDAGVPVTIGADDPPFFNTTLTDELLTLPGAFGLTESAIEGIVLNAARYSFLPEERRRELERAMRTSQLSSTYDT